MVVPFLSSKKVLLLFVVRRNISSNASMCLRMSAWFVCAAGEVEQGGSGVTVDSEFAVDISRTTCVAGLSDHDHGCE